MQNSGFWIRITSLYRSQTLPIDFCIQKRDFSNRIASLYGSQLSYVVFACKITWLASEILVSMGPSPHLCCLLANCDFGSELQVSMGPRLRLLICECKNSVLRSRMTIVYSTQPSSVVLCVQNSDFSIRINSLYVSQTSPVVLCMQTTWLASELLDSMGPSPYRWFLHAKQRL